MPSAEHFPHLIWLLELEAEAEARQLVEQLQRLADDEAEQTGNSLRGLVVRDHDVALGGRALLTLGKRDQRQLLPWNRLGVGTPVLLSEPERRRDESWRGVVCARNENTIQIAFEDLPELSADPPPLRVDLSFDEVARRRQRAALEQAARAERGRLAQLRDVLLGERAPRFRQQETLAALNQELNASQREAVEFALAAEDVAIIHGPPGTGKTTTVVELIRQAICRGEKVLACAPSNLAVDNLLERLIAAGENAIRLGHPARVSPELQAHTLDLLVANHPDVALARKLVKQAQSLRDRAARYTRARPAPGAKREMRQEAKELLADARRLEDQVVQQYLDSASVLCATLTGVDGGVLGKRAFDLAVIDEAAQTTEAACWIPLLRCSRVVLAGDHCQLPPTIVSAEAAKAGLSITLMQRLVADYAPQPGRQTREQAAGPYQGETRHHPLARLLTVQYRMHETIMGFSSAEFYESSLVADESVRGHLLADLPDVATDDLTGNPITFIDTAGASYDEEQEPEGESRFNPQEAAVVLQQVERLRQAGVAPRAVAVISPYAAQVRLLRSLLRREDCVPGVEVDTIDGFQGREKEAVIISLVRSNATGEIGFLADVRRMNVALTRARRKLIVIGDSATVANHPFYRRLLEYFERHGEYRTVWE